MRTCHLDAPASRSIRTGRAVLPRTMESSTNDQALARITRAAGWLEPDTELRGWSATLMKRAADVGVLDQALAYGMRTAARSRCRRGAGLRRRDHQVRVDRENSWPAAARWHPRGVHGAPAIVVSGGPGSVPKTQPFAPARRSGGCAARSHRWASSSPGSTSRTKLARRCPARPVALASTQPRSRRRAPAATPCGSRAAYNVDSSRTPARTRRGPGQQPDGGLLDSDVGGGGREQLGDQVESAAERPAVGRARRPDSDLISERSRHAADIGTSRRPPVRCCPGPRPFSLVFADESRCTPARDPHGVAPAGLGRRLERGWYWPARPARAGHRRTPASYA